MTDKAPERIWVRFAGDRDALMIRHWDRRAFEYADTEYVRADLLEAAQARIATARAEALEEAEQAFINKSTPGERVPLSYILETIRALKGDKNV